MFEAYFFKAKKKITYIIWVQGSFVNPSELLLPEAANDKQHFTHQSGPHVNKEPLALNTSSMHLSVMASC